MLVTQPASGDPKRSPTVVLVHGGPFVRARSGPWEPTAQFWPAALSALEPEFVAAAALRPALPCGLEAMGLRMQDDLADTLAWAVRQAGRPHARLHRGRQLWGYVALMVTPSSSGPVLL